MRSNGGRARGESTLGLALGFMRPHDFKKEFKVPGSMFKVAFNLQSQTRG
jgi:hypothetical protein